MIAERSTRLVESGRQVDHLRFDGSAIVGELRTLCFEGAQCAERRRGQGAVLLRLLMIGEQNRERCVTRTATSALELRGKALHLGIRLGDEGLRVDARGAGLADVRLGDRSRVAFRGEWMRGGAADRARFSGH